MRLPFARALLLYVGLGLGWLGFARFIAPTILADAYHGRSLPLFNRVLAQTSRHPLEHYLGLWQDFTGAVLLGLVGHAMIVGLIACQRANRRLTWFLVGYAAV